MVFKTSVVTEEEVRILQEALEQAGGDNCQWNFDLQDRDRIFRISAGTITASATISLFQNCGFECEELE